MAVLCPVCNSNFSQTDTSFSNCQKCGEDLTAFLSISYAPDMLVNQAVKLIESGDYRMAYDKLSAAHYLRPHDNEIVLEMARICELIEDYQGAMEKIAILLSDSDDEKIKEEYIRLNKLLQASEKLKKADAKAREQMFYEIKDVIKSAFAEFIRETQADNSELEKE